MNRPKTTYVFSMMLGVCARRRSSDEKQLLGNDVFKHGFRTMIEINQLNSFISNGVLYRTIQHKRHESQRVWLKCEWPMSV